MAGSSAVRGNQPSLGAPSPRAPSSLSAYDFVRKWSRSARTERAAAHEHFLDLCRVLGKPTPNEDPTGATYAFEKGARKTSGGDGFADVWRDQRFAWEYKGKRKSLQAAYEQLLQYRESLGNPPLLVVCDLDRFQVHTNYTGTTKRVYEFALDDLVGGGIPSTFGRPPLEVLRLAFDDPDQLKPEQTSEDVTKAAAGEFAGLAASLEGRGHSPALSAKFLVRLLFCLFAEDMGLLPNALFTTLVERTRDRPAEFAARLKRLFAAMATGGSFGVEDIRRFNGGLFEDDETLPLTTEDLGVLRAAGALDWSAVEPAIFGTLIERSLDPLQRAQFGTHYTDKEAIERVIEPVLMAPLRRRWREVQGQAQDLADKRARARGSVRTRHANALQKLLVGFAGEIAATRVLDPACGSGNFLYLALKELLDLEKEVVALAYGHGLKTFFPRVAPEQLYGIEINPYARQVASVVVWIGYIQWMIDNGFGYPADPILRPIETIELKDALLAQDADGRPGEPTWPGVDVIVGNPPFLGGKLLRAKLGDRYVDALFELYRGRVPREADRVAYWFERARAQIAAGRARRAGLLATQGIRGGANRRVLERIKETGDLFFAWSDLPWVLDGAAVRVSMVGFDRGEQQSRLLNGQLVPSINADLTASLDLTRARSLCENLGLAFMGDTKGGAFDLPPGIAERMLRAPMNPNGRPNGDVVVPWVNGLDVTRRPRDYWIVDFGIDMPESEAMLYEQPFEHVVRQVKPERGRSRSTRAEWWLHERPRVDMRRALAPLTRFIATPGLAKHRLFVWLRHPTLADHALMVFAREDDYFFGVLHSKPHELWALRLGTALEDRPRYTPTSTFETFPFPWPPGAEPAGDSRVDDIGQAARTLVQFRDRWLNPPSASPDDLKRRTLTALYNQRQPWLVQAHRILDDAVLDAYGWPRNLDDEAILERLLALNLARAAAGGSSPSAVSDVARSNVVKLAPADRAEPPTAKQPTPRRRKAAVR